MIVSIAEGDALLPWTGICFVVFLLCLWYNHSSCAEQFGGGICHVILRMRTAINESIAGMRKGEIRE